MSPPTLTLSRAELFFLPADTPATAPATRLQITPKDGEPFSALARLVQVLPLEKNEAWLYFWDERRPNDEIIGGGYIWWNDEKTYDERTTPEAIANQIAQNPDVWRFWAPPNGEFAIQFYGEGLVYVVTEPHKRDARTHISNFAPREKLGSLAQCPNSQIEDYCQELWSGNDSPLNRFFHWQSLSEDEQKAAVSTVQHGDWEKMTQMLRLALKLRLHAFGLPPARIMVLDFPR